MASNKVREYEDFRELGAYLVVARDALSQAHMLLANDMYRKDSKEVREVERLVTAVNKIRHNLDNRWPRELTTGENIRSTEECRRVHGPEPIMTSPENRPDHARAALSALDRLSSEGKSRRRDWQKGRLRR